MPPKQSRAVVTLLQRKQAPSKSSIIPNANLETAISPTLNNTNGDKKPQEQKAKCQYK